MSGVTTATVLTVCFYSRTFYKFVSNYTMKNLKRIDFLFSLSGLVIFAIGLGFLNSNFEINFHDTYLVVAQWHVATMLMTLYFLISVIYYSFTKFSRKLNQRAGFIHYSLTTVCLAILIFPPSFLFKPTPYTLQSENFAPAFGVNEMLALICLLFIVAQLIFLANIIYTLVTPKGIQE